VLRLGRPRRFDRGEFLHYEGDGPGGVYGIFSGGLGVMLGRRDGTSGLSTIIRAGTWIGEAPLHSGGARIIALRAVEPSETLYVELRDLATLAADDPDVRRRYGWMMLFNTQHALQAMSDLQISGTGRRLAATLLRVTAVAEGVEPDHPDGFLVTQSELGEMANVSRNRVNRLITAFAKEGWVTVGYNRIRIDDPVAIQRCIQGLE
jgi:CRP-like cAMP-binding protein